MVARGRTAAWIFTVSCLPFAAHGSCDESGGIQAGQWVRVETSPKLGSEGLALVQWKEDGVRVPPPARLVSHDDSSVTIDMQGRRLRLLRPGTGFQGVVAALDDKALEFVGPEPPVIVPLASISKMDVRQRKSRKGRGALIGLLGGAALGALVGAGSGSGKSGLGIDGPSLGAAAGAAIGAPVGVLIGLLAAPGARWLEDVDVTQYKIKRPSRSEPAR